MKERKTYGETFYIKSENFKRRHLQAKMRARN